MRTLLDTSALVADDAPAGVQAGISAASISGLHFGVLVARDPEERVRRLQRLATVEATFEPLPATAEIARTWGRLAAAVTLRGGNPRRRQVDLVIAATALTEHVPLLTHDLADLAIIEDLVDARLP